MINQNNDSETLRILLVEDSEDNVLVMQLYLKKFPYRLDVAENGQVGVDMFKQAKYDLVLMDIQMPIMDGYEATREIRRFEGEQGRSKAPIIAVTAHASEENHRMVLEAGCDDFITKPVPKAKLLEAIQRVAT
ncbi:MAG: response regulator [Proteobacteria bacterium]|nr:response regulator [Pseudomonadota bacterium]